MNRINTETYSHRVSFLAAAIGGLVMSISSATLLAADTAKEVKQAVNVFINADVTKGVPMTVDAKGRVAISSDVEYPGFAFGTYDVDASASSVTMTLATDPTKLQVGTYDSDTKDLYYYEFDRSVIKATLAKVADGFVATVTVLSAGEAVETKGAFADGLATSFTFEKGGVLVTIGEGSALRTVGKGGSLTVDLEFE